MSESDNDSIQSAESLSDELFTCCCTSGTLSEEGLREIIELHGLTPNCNHLSDYQFFRSACCNKNVTEGIIQYLLEYFPDAASDADDDGQLPLHYACCNTNVTLGVIQHLVEAAPDSVRREDNGGMMPLHFLCSNRKMDVIKAVEILKLLLEKYPESVRHENDDGQLPIQCASMMLKSPEFCRLLVEAYPGSERIAEADGTLPIHSACMTNVVATVEHYYNLYPDGINHTTTSGLYPIHAAMITLDSRSEPKMDAVEVVEFLLGCDPNVKYQEVRQGESLLHRACQCEYNDASIEAALGIINVLHDVHPEFIHKEDSGGNLPLHILCTNECESAAMEILKLLLEKYPGSIRRENNAGLLPIHNASMMSRSPEFCRALIEAYPGSERMTTRISRMLPLHYACIRDNVATVEYLYKLYPDGINHATSQMLYPVHNAISSLVESSINNRGAVDIVKFLLGCDPRVKFQKLLGRVSLFAWACFIDYNDANIEAALGIIKAIYDAHPEAIETDVIASNIYNLHPRVQVFVTRQLAYSRLARDRRLMTTPDGNGQLPLHTVLQSNATLGSIKLIVKGNPPAVQSPDNSGSLPLHIACAHHDSPSVVQYLVGLDTVTLDAVDHYNNTALHYACRGAKHETITLLLEKYDAVSVSKRNAQKKLPIDLLWESNEVLDRESVEYMESVFRLLKAYPETTMNCT